MTPVGDIVHTCNRYYFWKRAIFFQKGIGVPEVQDIRGSGAIGVLPKTFSRFYRILKVKNVVFRENLNLVNNKTLHEHYTRCAY